MENSYLEEDYESLPDNVQQILFEFDNDNKTYEQCRELEGKLNVLGYGIDWELDGSPFNLHKI